MNDVRTIPQFTPSAAAHYAAARVSLMLAERLIDRAEVARRSGDSKLAEALHEQVRELHTQAKAEMAAAEVTA